MFRGGTTQDAFERTLTLLYAAAVTDSQWVPAAASINDLIRTSAHSPSYANPSPPDNPQVRWLLLALVAGVASCGGDGATPPAAPPPPPPPPVAPVQVGTIPNQAIATGQSATLEVSAYFHDPDGGALTYTAASSAAGVVSVSLSGSTLTMVGVADGTGTVTVMARDPDGLTAAQGFQVAVETPNRAPEAVGTISDQTVATGSTVTLDVSSYFRDPDADALTYSVASPAAAVISVSLSGTTLTMVGVADGTGTVTVTARDPDGLTAAQAFRVMVETPNQVPEAVGTIPNQTIQVGETVALDVSPYFTDADGDELTYAAASSNTSVTVSVSGAAVRIQGVGVGRTTLTVTAHDPGGASATQRANVGITAPAPDLVFTGVSPASVTLTPGESVTFTFRVRNRGTVASGATTIRAMRSANPTISPRDTELESYSLPALAPAQDRSFPVTVVVDQNSAPGTIYLGMCVDPAMEESNTRNNCSEGGRLTVVRSSSARESAAGEPSVRIRTSRARGSTRLAKQL